MTKTLPLRSALAVCLLALSLAAPASARVDSRAQRLHLIWPADGTVTAGFGEWRGGHRHSGLDIGMLRSLRVRSATGGKVESVGYVPGYEGYGDLVVVRFGPYRVLYAHLASALVRPDQIITAGQQLGVAGCTGSCSGTHLHFEVRHLGVPIDPRRFLG
jgi:murein DD-endopeptidase MepM/ murein hydrolase activator NlpD